MNKFIKFTKALFITAGRAEYFSADITPFLIGCFLATKISSWNLELFIIGLLTVISAHYSAVWSNVLSDYDLDKKYKSYLPNAVDIIGKKTLVLFITLSSLIGTILSLLLSLWAGSYLLFILWILGLTSAHIYTLEPIRLKKYPLIGDIARGFPIIIPMIFGYIIFNNAISPILVVNFVGISINLLGLFLIGEVWDYKDDVGYVKTLAIKFGYKKCVYAGGILTSLGLIFWLSYYYIYWKHNLLIEIYLYLSLILLLSFICFFYVKIIKEISNYYNIERKCGLITKIGTSFMWLWQLIGAFLFNQIYFI